MTDYVLKSADQATMYAAFTADGIYVDGVLKTQGILADGGGWCLVDQGPRTIQTGVDDQGEPIYVTDEYWVPLRWNFRHIFVQPVAWRDDSQCIFALWNSSHGAGSGASAGC